MFHRFAWIFPIVCHSPNMQTTKIINSTPSMSIFRASSIAIQMSINKCFLPIYLPFAKCQNIYFCFSKQLDLNRYGISFHHKWKLFFSHASAMVMDIWNFMHLACFVRCVRNHFSVLTVATNVRVYHFWSRIHCGITFSPLNRTNLSLEQEISPGKSFFEPFHTLNVWWKGGNFSRWCRSSRACVRMHQVLYVGNIVWLRCVCVSVCAMRHAKAGLIDN